MNYSDVISAVNQYKKGQFFSIVYSKELPLLKLYAGENVVIKRSKAIVRVGVAYDHIKAVAEKRKDGVLTSVNSGLPWGEWDIPGYTIKHKDKFYLRVALVNGNPIHSKYYLNGVEKDPDVVRYLCQSTAVSSGRYKPDILTVCMDNIEQIGSYN